MRESFAGAEAPPGFAPLKSGVPFLELVGPVFVEAGSDPPVLGLAAGERHCNQRGTVMGGMLATLVDIAFGLAFADCLLSASGQEIVRARSVWASAG
jgi:acyl-coenzyme A thioesterase PaaI-like protein